MRIQSLPMLVLVPFLAWGTYAISTTYASSTPTSGSWLTTSAQVTDVSVETARISVSFSRGLPNGPGGNQRSNSSTPNLPSAPGPDPRPTKAEVKQSITGTTGNPTSTTTPITQSATTTTSASAWSRLPAEPCWSFTDCSATLTDMTYCYNVSGNLAGPNGRDGDGHSPMYRDIFAPPTTKDDFFLQNCSACFKNAGWDTESANSPTSQSKWKTYDFCHADRRNLYELLSYLFVFMTKTDAPTSFDKMPSQATAVVAQYSDVFTSTPGVDRPTTSPTQTSRPGPGVNSIGETTWWDAPLTSGTLLPTQYLSQLPANWPYTSHGLASSTASWALTQPDSSSTVAWVLADVSWFPRPLLNSESTLLDGWSHAFRYEIVTITSPPSPAPSITTSQIRGPFAPRITQESVLPKEPDSDAEIRVSMASSSEAARSRSKTKSLLQGMMMAAPGAEAGVVAKSVKSRLGRWGWDFERAGHGVIRAGTLCVDRICCCRYDAVLECYVS